jgi:hypothetical protein
VSWRSQLCKRSDRGPQNARGEAASDSHQHISARWVSVKSSCTTRSLRRMATRTSVCGLVCPSRTSERGGELVRVAIRRNDRVVHELFTDGAQEAVVLSRHLTLRDAQVAQVRGLFACARAGCHAMRCARRAGCSRRRCELVAVAGAGGAMLLTMG